MKLEFHPQAEQEFLGAVLYYEAEVPGLGERFDAEVRTASALLLEYPEIGPLGHNRAGVARRRTRRWAASREGRSP